MTTITTELVDEDRKRDARGHRMIGKKERERLLGAYEASGLTQVEFARREGINVYTLRAWLGRRRRDGSSRESPGSAGFHQIELSGPLCGVEILLPSGVRVRCAGAAQAAELLKNLAGH